MDAQSANCPSCARWLVRLSLRAHAQARFYCAANTDEFVAQTIASAPVVIFSKTTCPYCEKGQYPTRDDAQHAGGWRTKPNLLHNALHCHAGALLHTLRGRHLRLHALLAI